MFFFLEYTHTQKIDYFYYGNTQRANKWLWNLSAYQMPKPKYNHQWSFFGFFFRWPNNGFLSNTLKIIKFIYTELLKWEWEKTTTITTEIHETSRLYKKNHKHSLSRVHSFVCAGREYSIVFSEIKNMNCCQSICFCADHQPIKIYFCSFFF